MEGGHASGRNEVPAGIIRKIGGGGLSRRTRQHGVWFRDLGWNEDERTKDVIKASGVWTGRALSQ